MFLLFFESGSSADGFIFVDVATVDVYFGEGDDGLGDEGGAAQGRQILVVGPAGGHRTHLITHFHCYKSSNYCSPHL